MDEINPKTVEKLKQLIVDNPYIQLGDLKKKAGVKTRDLLDLHLYEIEKDEDYAMDLYTWKINIDLRPKRNDDFPGKKRPLDMMNPKLKKVAREK